MVPLRMQSIMEICKISIAGGLCQYQLLLAHCLTYEQFTRRTQATRRYTTRAAGQRYATIVQLGNTFTATAAIAGVATVSSPALDLS
jgi:hypothetical protein